MHGYKLLEEKNGNSFVEVKLLLFVAKSVIGNLSAQLSC